MDPPKIPKKLPSPEEIWIDRATGKEVKVSSFNRGMVTFFEVWGGGGGIMAWPSFEEKYTRKEG